MTSRNVRQVVVIWGASFLLAAASIATAGSADKLVLFSTRILGPSAQVSDMNGMLLTGNDYFAQLYSGYGLDLSADLLLPIGVAANFQYGLGAGYVRVFGTNAFGMQVPALLNAYEDHEPQGPATVQLRAWSAPFPTYEDALAGGGQYGASLPLNVPVTGLMEGVPLIGLQGFTLIPEPPTWSLGLLGAVVVLGARWATAKGRQAQNSEVA